MNLETNISNLNYLRYMEYTSNGNGANKGHFESERATIKEKQEEKEK